MTRNDNQRDPRRLPPGPPPGLFPPAPSSEPRRSARDRPRAERARPASATPPPSAPTPPPDPTPPPARVKGWGVASWHEERARELVERSHEDDRGPDGMQDLVEASVHASLAVAARVRGLQAAADDTAEYQRQEEADRRYAQNTRYGHFQ